MVREAIARLKADGLIETRQGSGAFVVEAPKTINLRFWQLEQQRNIFEYSMGKVSADALREITIPYYDAISAEVVAVTCDQPTLRWLGVVPLTVAHP